MKIAIVSDAWLPQVNGVVMTMKEVVRYLESVGHVVELFEPGQFSQVPCPGYDGIDLAVLPGRQVAKRLDAFAPDAIHLVTEGPLGWAARRWCLRRGMAFTSAFHTKFPEIVNAAVGVPVDWGYAVLRRFHAPSAGIMVPTRSVLQMLLERGFHRLRPWTHGVDTSKFEVRSQPQDHELLPDVRRPLALLCGRISYEKNVEAFLKMPFHGTKAVCGTGPVAEKLKRLYPEVRWLGLQPHDELPRIYGAADVLVFPSFADTFGLVLVEAMACGTPVAAHLSDGPLEVLGGPRADGGRGSMGGAMHENIAEATRRALMVPRMEARSRALEFRWEAAAAMFESYLVPCRGTRVQALPPTAGLIPR